MQWSQAFNIVCEVALTNKVGMAMELMSHVTSLCSPFDYVSFKWTRIFYHLPFVALMVW